MSVSDAQAAPAALLEIIEYAGGGRHRPYRKSDIGPTPAAAVTASRQVLGGGDVCELMGYAFAETTGVAGASLRLRDGNNNATEVLCRINLAANESVRDMFTAKGIDVFTGRIFIEILSGSVEGVLFWR